MELVRAIWIFIFFFFALILIFTWSKMAVISNKIKAITRLAENLGKLSETAESPKSPEQEKQSGQQE